jgi:carotenoid cleavage dioxygenase-like enzyme
MLTLLQDSPIVTSTTTRFHAEDWAAAFASQAQEFYYWVDHVDGTIPGFLNGTLFRNGPGKFGEDFMPSLMPASQHG